MNVNVINRLGTYGQVHWKTTCSIGPPLSKPLLPKYPY